MVNTSANIANKNLDLAMAVSPQVSRTDSQWINSHMLGFIRGATSHPELSDFETKLYTASREYAKVSTGSSASVAELSAAATAQVERLLNSAQDPKTLAAAIQAMRDDMNSIVTSNNETITGLQQQLKGLHQPGQASTQPAAQSTQNAAAPGSPVMYGGKQYKVGDIFVGPDGSKVVMTPNGPVRKAN